MNSKLIIDGLLALLVSKDTSSTDVGQFRFDPEMIMLFWRGASCNAINECLKKRFPNHGLFGDGMLEPSIGHVKVCWVDVRLRHLNLGILENSFLLPTNTSGVKFNYTNSCSMTSSMRSLPICSVIETRNWSGMEMYGSHSNPSI